MHSTSHACTDSNARACQQELLGLEASVKALEQHVAEISSHVRKESSTIPKVRRSGFLAPPQC